MAFQLPELHVNPQFSWGPPAEELTIDGQPFHLYFKESPLVAVDWSSAFREEQEVSNSKAKQGGFTVVEDDTRLRALEIDRARNKKQSNFRKPANNTKQGRRRQERARRITELLSTYPVRSSTKVFAEFNQHDMSKFRIDRPPQIVDMLKAGLPCLYDTELDKVTVNRPKMVDESKYDASYFGHESIAKDTPMRALLRGFSGKVVVVSDEVLAAIMTGNLTMHPWHVKATRFNDIVILDKDMDDEMEGNVGRQWVSETASREVAPSEDDAVQSLRISALGDESTKAHNAFIKMSCKATKANMKTEKNPFPGTQPRLYSYRNFKVNPGTPDEYNVLVRCEVDSVTADNKFIRLFGLLEQPNKEDKSEWRKTMAGGGSSGLPKAFDMNRGKIGRWIALSNLANASLMKIGFLTRVKNLRSPDELAHEVLSVQTDTPQSLAAQLGINVLNLWAIADTIFTAVYSYVKSGESVMIVKPSGEGRIVVCEADDEDDDDDDDDESEDSDEEEEEDDEDNE